MSYRERPDFDRPTVESIQRSRRSMAWVIPLVVIQQGFAIFRHGADLAGQLLAIFAWVTVSITILWMLFGLPVRWLPERDQAILNDEWNQSVSGNASRWGIAALILIGCGMMFARVWLPIDAGVAIYGLVNGALIVAVARYAWLNRAEPDEDE
jgi:hypothetical protein